MNITPNQRVIHVHTPYNTHTANTCAGLQKFLKQAPAQDTFEAVVSSSLRPNNNLPGCARFDVLRADVLFCKISSDAYYVPYETAITWGWAAARGIPVVVLAPPERPFDAVTHSFINTCILKGIVADRSHTWDHAVQDIQALIRHQDDLCRRLREWRTWQVGFTPDQKADPLIINLRNADGTMREPTLEEALDMGLADAICRPIALVGDAVWLKARLPQVILTLVNWYWPDMQTAHGYHAAISTPGS